MAGPLAAGIIAAGTQLIGAAGNWMSSGKLNRDTQIWNQQMYDRQRRDALSDWAMQNAYNSPAEQKKRLAEAGLNPNLVYGSGANAQGGQVRATDAKQWNPERPDFSGIGRAASEGIAAYQNARLMDEQVQNIQAQRKNLELDSVLKVVKASGDTIKNARTKLELDKARVLYDTGIAYANEQLRSLSTGTDIRANKEVRDAAMAAPNLAAAIERVNNLRASNKLSAQQLANLKQSGVLQDMEIKMRKLGLSYNDGVILRMLAQFAGGQSLPDVVKNIGAFIKKMSGKAIDEVNVK